MKTRAAFERIVGMGTHVLSLVSLDLLFNDMATIQLVGQNFKPFHFLTMPLNPLLLQNFKNSTKLSLT